MTIRPQRDRVLLELIPNDMVSTGGLHIPDNSKRKYIRTARVLAVASDCKEPLLVPGRVVYAVWNCGVPVELGHEQETRLIKSEDVYVAEIENFDGHQLVATPKPKK